MSGGEKRPASESSNHASSPKRAAASSGPLRGLQNFGNTCFLNSALQMLGACEEMERSRLLGPFFSGLRSGRQMNAMGARALVMRRFPDFRNSNQHDSHEWLLRLLEVLEEKGDKSSIAELFDGKHEVTVCFPDCGHINRHDESFRTLSLDLPSEDGGSLARCFDGFSDAAQVYSTCDEACKSSERKRAVKAMRVSSLPRYLIIHWKRFAQRGAKSDRRVSCPTIFRGFELVGLVNHAGSSARSGHYTACSKIGDQWYLANDSRACPIESHHAVKAAERAYLVMYRRIG